MNQFIHPAALADSIMAEATKLMKAWLAMPATDNYRQTHNAVEDEFVTLCTLEGRLIALLQVNGLPADIRILTQEYLGATEERVKEIWDYASAG